MKKKNKKDDCVKNDDFTTREIIFLIVFAFVVLCFGIYEMIGRYDSICECLDCVSEFRDNNMEQPDENDIRQENILEIPNFHHYKNKMSAPDVDMVDISTQTDPQLYNNPMFVNI